MTIWKLICKDLLFLIYVLLQFLKCMWYTRMFIDSLLKTDFWDKQKLNSLCYLFPLSIKAIRTIKRTYPVKFWRKSVITSLDKKKVNSQKLYKSLNYFLLDLNIQIDEIDQLEIQIMDKFFCKYRLMNSYKFM